MIECVFNVQRLYEASDSEAWDVGLERRRERDVHVPALERCDRDRYEQCDVEQHHDKHQQHVQRRRQAGKDLRESRYRADGRYRIDQRVLQLLQPERWSRICAGQFNELE